MNQPTLQIPKITKMMTTEEEYFWTKMSDYYQDFNNELEYWMDFGWEYDMNIANKDRFMELINDWDRICWLANEYKSYIFTTTTIDYINKVRPIIQELVEEMKDSIRDLIAMWEDELLEVKRIELGE